LPAPIGTGNARAADAGSVIDGVGVELYVAVEHPVPRPDRVTRHDLEAERVTRTEGSVVNRPGVR
jgi:hypothetical protein